MASLRRNWVIINPPAATKQQDALKFGVLGAANIAPMALITPARSHPEVIVHAVAARDKGRATTFAKKHGIPVVKDSYDAILDDPEINVVYIPLPAGLHYEWAVKALGKGKHVLLEKPSTANLVEAETLFHNSTLSQPNKPLVLMEAFHSRFTPAWRIFLDALDQPNISHALATAMVPSFVAKDDDIRFNYEIGGGALLDLGTYPVAALRVAFGAEPTECVDAKMTPMAPPREKCDHTFHAKYSFPNGGIGEVDGTLRAPNRLFPLPAITVTHKPVPTPEEEKEEGTEVLKTRKVIFYNFMFSPHYHRVDIEDTFEVKQGTNIVRTFTRKEKKKAYTYEEAGLHQPGEIYWSTYRYMMEQFVNRVKGREGNGLFISPDDSISQARALDLIYTKAGLGHRPSSKYWAETGQEH
ncbi:hypothetical protein CJF31_00009252 [Rutstroemia sp. NJR-2017a BVV2]|nr:hypothetical protein CJF31_00009252 [Rutstroemia sp. NJR-2017a BVV2]